MNDSAEARKTKDRSPAFPFITLEAALGRARRFYDEEKRGVAPMTRATLHWGYSPSSSGALQTIAALKNYGLMTEEGGSGQNRQIRLTDLALRILLDQRPNSTERLMFMRQAAKTPSIAAEVYSKWPDGLPSDSTLNHFLVLEKKFNESTAFKVVKIIKENHALTEMSSIDIQSDNGMIEKDEKGYESDEMEALDTDRYSETAGRQPVIPVDKSVGRGKQIGASIPVTSTCSMSVVADGEVTQDGIDRLISYLNLIKGSFSKAVISEKDDSISH